MGDNHGGKDGEGGREGGREGGVNRRVGGWESECVRMLTRSLNHSVA